MLASGGSGLVTTLQDLRFEGYRMPLAALLSLQTFSRLRTLSLNGSSVQKAAPGDGPQPGLEATDHVEQVLEAARQLLLAGTLARVSACGTSLGEALGHARGQLGSACHIETVPF